MATMKRMLPRPIFLLLQPMYHFMLGFAAAAVYGFPSRHISVIGVTGTKGKTTVVHLLHDILASSGEKVASLSSLRFRIGEREEENQLKMTMPGRFFLQKFLRRAVRAGCRWAVIEVTSQGIAQSRHRFIKFGAAVMTNVAPEHIEAHGSFERYLRSKLDLFWRLRPSAVAIINRDDPQSRRFCAATAAVPLLYGRMGIDVKIKSWPVREVVIGSNGISFDIGDQQFTSTLIAEFNFYNILAAITTGLSQHLRLEKMARAVAEFSGVAGRMEFIARQPFAVVVDYAHTPDSLRSVYQTLRSEGQTANGKRQKINGKRQKTKAEGRRMICVLGSAGGGRDRWKRPELGKIAAEFCEEIILTNEDPYDEDQTAILEEIASGLPLCPKPKTQNPRPQKILDRRTAIQAALQSAKPGDTVVITGKGAEPWIMGRDGGKIPWDDRAVAREELQKCYHN